MYTAIDHTFVICAYKDNPHLEETILSLKNQTLKCKVALSTSTPSEYIENICKNQEIEMYINPNPKGAGSDWNYAYKMADTKLVTIAHQDDFYEPEFLETVLKYMNKRDDIIITFTDYYEQKLGKKETKNTLLFIKRLMNWPMSLKVFQKSKFVRRRMLSIGCAICCPAVTYVKENAGEEVFDTKYINSCDYKTWVNLSAKKGAFVYIKKQLIAHRIYAESATTLNLSENIRAKEDLEILSIFWPKPIAKLINKLYSTSEKSNKV